MLQLDRSRHTLAALGLVALAALAACGSSRDVAEDRPLCQRCHGGTSGNAAPPTSVNGATATTDVKVGAHQAHVVAGRLRGPIACAECHVVPADMRAHEAGIAAIAARSAQPIVFGPLAAQGAAGAAYDAAGTLRCSNTYCHGATLNHGGTNQAPKWTGIDAGHTEAACGTCHFQRGDAFPVGHPATSDDCFSCHPQTVNADNASINVATGLHMNGAIDGGCTSCHGAPPADRGHQIHAIASAVVYGDTRVTADLLSASTTRYAFGCGNCHPLDFAAHAVHTGASPSLLPIVDLSRAGAPAGSLRARNGDAASFDPVAKTCSGVYCHSSGQANPGYVTSPGWTSGATLGCGGCHANPPRYVSGGAGAADANSHLGLLSFAGDVLEAGHFAGFPGVSHSYSKHGGAMQPSTSYWYGESSAPITCQTCHFDTADGANTGPSGFYYLDTTGDYEVGGTAGITLSCDGCHAGTPAPGIGAVRPYFHVNGVRDVAFDRRAILDVTGTPTLPGAPNTPTRPYWYGNASGWVAALLPGNMDGTTLSLDLTAASWNAADKSCGTVSCHLNRTSVQWGEPLDAAATCLVCHNK